MSEYTYYLGILITILTWGYVIYRGGEITHEENKRIRISFLTGFIILLISIIL